MYIARVRQNPENLHSYPSNCTRGDNPEAQEVKTSPQETPRPAGLPKPEKRAEISRHPFNSRRRHLETWRLRKRFEGGRLGGGDAQTVHAWPGPIQSQNLSYQFLPVEPAKSLPRPPPPPPPHYCSLRMGRHLVPPVSRDFTCRCVCLIMRLRSAVEIYNWTPVGAPTSVVGFGDENRGFRMGTGKRPPVDHWH